MASLTGVKNTRLCHDTSPRTEAVPSGRSRTRRRRRPLPDHSGALFSRLPAASNVAPPGTDGEVAVVGRLEPRDVARELHAAPRRRGHLDFDTLDGRGCRRC